MWQTEHKKRIGPYPHGQSYFLPDLTSWYTTLTGGTDTHLSLFKHRGSHFFGQMLVWEKRS